MSIDYEHELSLKVNVYFYIQDKSRIDKHTFKSPATVVSMVDVAHFTDHEGFMHILKKLFSGFVVSANVDITENMFYRIYYSTPSGSIMEGCGPHNNPKLAIENLRFCRDPAKSD